MSRSTLGAAPFGEQRCDGRRWRSQGGTARKERRAVYRLRRALPAGQCTIALSSAPGRAGFASRTGKNLRIRRGTDGKPQCLIVQREQAGGRIETEREPAGFEYDAEHDHWRCPEGHIHCVGSLAELEELSGVALDDPLGTPVAISPGGDVVEHLTQPGTQQDSVKRGNRLGAVF